MAVTHHPLPAERAVFWYGCNLLRHGDILRLTARFLEAVGVDAAPRGGPAHCCGSTTEHNARITEGMGRRTLAAFNATGRDKVITWCPSCHMNMDDLMAPETPAQFATTHVTEVLWERRAALQKLLVQPVHLRVLLHRHAGFQPRVAVNDSVSSLLRLIPGLDLVEDEEALPGHMCSALAGVPAALAAAHEANLAAMARHGADTLCTIFHSCHREAVALERGRAITVMNWVHLLARSAGFDYRDEYKHLRNADDPRAALDDGALARVGADVFTHLLEPELRRKPVV
jgi:Fe-S oxidoreductase